RHSRFPLDSLFGSRGAMSNSEINLIKKDVSSFRKIAFLEEKLRFVTLWFLGLLLVGGITIGISFLVMSSRMKTLESRKIELTKQINLQTVKEGILLSLKERTGIAGKALDAAKPWGKLFTLLGLIASEANYNALSIEESGRVTANIYLGSIDEAVVVVSNTISLADEKMLRSPQLISFVFKEDGIVQLSLSFHPAL
ncbi:MAG: hypothetical protein AAB960_00500, partial [Patescibacteria group bacterium]